MMKRNVLYILVAVLCMGFNFPAYADKPVSVRKERKLITEGNKLYSSGQYRRALLKYQDALKANAASPVGRYNLGLTQLRLGTNPADTTPKAKEMLETGLKNLQQIASMGAEKPKLAAMASFNLGNVAFNAEDYQNALGLYKQALRLNPADDAARRNLRITQLKLQNQDQNQDQNKDQNQDQNKDQNQDQNKDQNKDQNQDQNKDQNQDNKDQQQDQQQQQQDQQLNQQTADQILQAIENKENQTRARVGTNRGDKSRGRNHNRKNW